MCVCLFLGGSDREDVVLAGKLKTLSSLVGINREFAQLAGSQQTGLLWELFDTCLFGQPESTESERGAHPPKCKKSNTRTAAFQLLGVLCRGNTDNLVTLIKQGFEPLQKRVSRITDWNYNPESLGRSTVGFVGLKNLGNICYMISILQQFFMIPAFRYGILSLEDTSENKEESLLHQLQMMFGHLQLSEKQDYNPRVCTTSSLPLISL